MAGFLRFGKGRGDSEEKLFGEAQQENMTQMHALGNFRVDLGTFCSDFSDFRMQNHSFKKTLLVL